MVHIRHVSIISIVSLISVSLCTDKVSYNGFSLFRITPKTEEQFEFLSSLLKDYTALLDVWLPSVAVNQSADVVVPPSLLKDFVERLISGGLHFDRLIEDLGKIIDEDASESRPCSVQPPYEFFCFYNSYEKIGQFMHDLVSEHPDHVSMSQFGTSYEGRPIYILQISTDANITKPVIWIQGGQHAREPVSSAVVAFLALKLISSMGKNDEIFELVDTFDWYILPVVNPDGYEYSQNVDRLWRKTRSFYPNEKNCTGVDANRNWDVKWSDASGSSSDPCSAYYAGPSPFSEPETKAISQYMTNDLSGPLLLFIDFHSYSQRWMTPYGYTHQLPPNYKEQKRLADITVAALKNVHGTAYRVGSTGNILYTITGGARDWVYDTMKANFSYDVELRDRGKYGFLLPKREIFSTCQETWAGIKAMTYELVKMMKRHDHPELGRI